jgi:hypothetical protein
MKAKPVRGPNAALIAFIYELLRDHLPAATIEHVTRNSPPTDYSLSNPYLADYARNVVRRLMRPHKKNTAP